MFNNNKLYLHNSVHTHCLHSMQVTVKLHVYRVILYQNNILYIFVCVHKHVIMIVCASVSVHVCAHIQ